MPPPLSPRLAAVLATLPLRPGLRVVEIGGAPGALARAVARRVAPGGHVLVVDRSARGVVLTERACAADIEAGLLSVRCVPGEELELKPGERHFDLAVANRVGALDGRHPQAGARLMAHLDRALTDDGEVWVDGRRRPRATRS
ncbi:MAG: SAM-dependent methyltransferase [Phycicoccus sp.]